MSTNHVNEQVQNIASAICLLCQIQSGKELVIIIGNGDETNNHKAIEGWVSRHLEKVDSLAPKQQIEVLQERLVNELGSWQL